MAKPIAGMRKVYLGMVHGLLREKPDTSISELRRLLVYRHNTQLGKSTIFMLRKDAAKLLAAEGKIVPKYVEPRSIAIRNAIRTGMQEGKSYKQISAELSAAGVQTTLKRLANVASEMRSRGEQIASAFEQKKRRFLETAILAGKDEPALQRIARLRARGVELNQDEFYKVRSKLVKKGVISAVPRQTSSSAVKKLLTEYPLMSDVEILERIESGMEPATSYLKKIRIGLRRQGVAIPLKRLSRKVPLPYTQQQREWVDSIFAGIQGAIRGVCASKHYSPEYASDFEYYVYRTLPIMMARAEVKKIPVQELLGYVKSNIRNYARKSFFQSWVMQKLSIRSSEAAQLARLLFLQRKGLSLKGAAGQIGASEAEASQLIDLLEKYNRFKTTISFNPDIGYDLQ